MTGDELERLKDLPVPEPRDAARAAALAAALAAFDAAAKNTDSPAQENAAPGRLTLASTQTQRRRLMRANFFNYKIAASIAVLIVAAPAVFYMLRQETPPVMRVAKEARSAASGENLPAATEKAAAPSRENKATPTIVADAQPSKKVPGNPGDQRFPNGERTIYDSLRPDGSTFAPPPPPEGKSLEGRIDEALRKVHREAGAPASPPGAGQNTVVRSESYSPSKNRIASQPSTTPIVKDAETGLPYPFSDAAAPKPAGPMVAPPAHVAGLKQDFDQTTVFRFGAATKFGDEPSRGQPSAGPGRRSESYASDGTRVASGRAAADTRLVLSGDNFRGQEVNVPPAEAEEKNRDQFEAFASNSVKQVAAEPVSTFSIDVDTASYSFVRRSLLGGRMPQKDAVRVEEMINYFPYAYPRPESGGVPFQPTVTVTPSPWKPTNKLVHIGIKGYEIAAKERPRANLVLLIDVSGSMAPEDRLPLLKNAFRMLLGELKADDTVGIVTYASQSGVALEPTRVAERGKILDVLNRLNAGGSTSGGQGLQDAYRLAEMSFDKNAVNRIILATDGDFNVGITDREELKRFIEAKRQTGIYLSVIGVGQDNYNDRLMQALAQNGNGVAAYVDTLNEARKVLVDEASSSLFPIAKDVKIQIEFNPARVSEYRLIGYETRALKREDFNNDKVDAGDVGSGHTVTAIYEITPAGAPKFVDELRYQKPETQPAPPSGTPGELGYLKIRYKLPGEETSKLITTPISADLERADIQAVPEDVRFSIAVAAFGQLLRGEPYLGAFSFDDAIALAQTARGADPFGYRAEFLNLLRLAKPARR
jgi:Ca-activated chloride channel homolog